MIEPRLFNRIAFGVAASLGSLALIDGVPKVIKGAATVLSVGLAAFANAEHLPAIGPVIAQRRAQIRASQGMPIAGIAPGAKMNDETPAAPLASEEITAPHVAPVPTSQVEDVPAWWRDDPSRRK